MALQSNTTWIIMSMNYYLSFHTEHIKVSDTQVLMINLIGEYMGTTGHDQSTATDTVLEQLGKKKKVSSDLHTLMCDLTPSLTHTQTHTIILPLMSLLQQMP